MPPGSPARALWSASVGDASSTRGARSSRPLPGRTVPGNGRCRPWAKFALKEGAPRAAIRACLASWRCAIIYNIVSNETAVRQTLYLKYRVHRFSDLVGQEVIAQTLRNSVREGRLSHAYLFTGIRGTGKTSAARILARAINCEQVEDGEPCGKCQPCVSIADQRSLDVIEIDAASNRGIDEIRDLRERAQFLPSQLRTKVYVIDEAHMLTQDAGNAFLKTLEEPPEHACFILATTEPHRLADTVLSRCQRFDFRRIPVEKMASHLAQICAQEGVRASEEALTLVAEAGSGSLRDALSLLDRLLGLAQGELGLEEVQAGLGMADPRALVRLAGALAVGGMGEAWLELSQLQASGAEPRQLMRSLGALAKLYLWQELGGDKGGAVALDPIPAPAGFWLGLLSAAAVAGSELRRADDPWMSLEASLLRLSRAGETTTSSSSGDARTPPTSLFGPTPEPVPMRTAGELPGTLAETLPPAPLGDGIPEVGEVERVPVPATPPPAEVPSDATPPSEAVGVAVQRWTEILDWLKRDNLPLQSLLKSGRAASHRDGVLTIEFGEKYEFHRGQIQSPANRELLQRACREVLGEELVVVVTTSGTELQDARQRPTGNGDAPSALSQAMNVFPGSRVTRVGTRDKR